MKMHAPAVARRPGRSSGAASALGRVTALTLWVVALQSIYPATSLAQEACYRDESGRILQRRVPGATEVPCPTGEPVIEATEPGAQLSESPAAADEPSRRGLDRRDSPLAARRPNPPSPIPRPTLDDYRNAAAIPLPDRWGIVDLLGYDGRRLDPYNRNVLKADRPVRGDDGFFNLGLISDTVYETRATGVPIATPPAHVAAFGRAEESVGVENLAVELAYYKGDTVFKPPDFELKFVPVFSYRRRSLEDVVDLAPSAGRGTDSHVAIQGAFVEKHLRNVGARYDFDSLRIGIQPFSTDFRGFLFQDQPFGVRLFGTRDGNRLQYNLAWLRRIEKDAASGLNDLTEPLRDDDLLVFNVYRQDTPGLGFTSQATLLVNRSRERDARSVAPGAESRRDYDVTYLGYNGDGHIGWLNLTASVYAALGEEDRSAFRAGAADIEAYFAALELSRDFDWVRGRVSFLYGSGDDDPFDDEAHGFDAIFENPQFAGADTSYWVRQAEPLVGPARVVLSGRNGVLNSLRSSKEQGQANFVNPGIRLFGLGADFDLSPQVRLALNWNALEFDAARMLQVVRNSGPIDDEIGQDVSLTLTYRPLMTQNVIVRASYAKLLAGNGFRALFPDAGDPGYWLFNFMLAY